MTLMIHEVLEKAAEAKTKEEKVSILKENNSLALRDILRGGMDDTIVFILPEGTPPYDADDAPVGYTRSSLFHQTKKFKYFVKGGPGESLMPVKRERMFIEVLESVHPKEAELVLLMKDKQLIKNTGTAHYKGITKKLVAAAFPGLLKDGTES